MLDLNSDTAASLRLLYKLDNNLIKNGLWTKDHFYAYFHGFVIDFQRSAVKAFLVTPGYERDE